MPARSLGRALLGLEGALALSTGYQLALLAGASRTLRRRPEAPPSDDPQSRFVVLIPAHDEEHGIGATLSSLAESTYPPERLRTVVIADNCSDLTAVRARDAGVEAWERVHDERGKGFALIWALERLREAQDGYDAVVVLDADCLVSPNMLEQMDRALRAGAEAVQVSYVIGNPEDSHASALRFAAFALMATVRPLGKQGFGLSSGLFGTGMGFTKELLHSEPWSATGLVEDFEYHLRLVDAGRRVEFLPRAWVRSAMPTSFAASGDQQARWEQGKLQVIRNWSLRLVLSGLRRGDPTRVHAGLEHLVPPQSLIAAGSLASLCGGLLLRSRGLAALATAIAMAQLTFVVVGLRLVQAPAQVYRALLFAPVLIAGKVALYLKLLSGGGPTSWVRTEREGAS
ncbi:MAG TPA: glycosyltransferase family 2 protein [Solirubrobacteraceae bacterium]|jgi:hypothetical protein|nr:glycosyltransferase family 2 protein [Solirubrobacteraceae bacterium]